jgi:glycogen synthase
MQKVFNEGMKDYSDNDRAVAIMEHAGQFSWENSASKYLALYEEVLNN